MKNGKLVAVLCYDLEDFKNWVKDEGYVSYGSPSNRIIYVDDDSYIGVYLRGHLCSYAINGVIETSSAHKNPHYSDLKHETACNFKDEKSERPPLGVIPRYLHNETRFTELRNAIVRYLDGYRYIDPEWIAEYNELLEKIQIKKI